MRILSKVDSPILSKNVRLCEMSKEKNAKMKFSQKKMSSHGEFLNELFMYTYTRTGKNLYERPKPVRTCRNLPKPHDFLDFVAKNVVEI